MKAWQVRSSRRQGAFSFIASLVSALAAGQASAAGMTIYEIGTADVGLASAGYNARAQDASTVLANPAGMTRLEGTQFLAAGQLAYGWTKFSIGSRTSPELGSDNGGNAFGWSGWAPGGGGFFSYSVSPELKLGFALTSDLGGVLDYDNSWVGRYYVQKTEILGISLLPSIAYKVTDKLSLGASVNVVYGIYENKVAINVPDALRPVATTPGQRSSGDGQLKLDDTTWGAGVNLGVLYEIDAGTRLGLIWNSQVNLNFSSAAQFSSVGALGPILASKGLLNSTVDVGIKVPQQAMGSIFAQVNPRWALLGSVGWQQWSKFGQIQLGLDDALTSRSLTTKIPFKDTWHFAAGAQYRVNDPWLLNFGIAYDTGFQSGNVSPLLPTNAQWRFGVGAEHQASKTLKWGFAAEYMYGGSLDVNIQSQTPVVAGGRGDLVGSYNSTGALFLAAYGSWKF